MLENGKKGGFKWNGKRYKKKTGGWFIRETGGSNKIVGRKSYESVSAAV